MNIVDIINKKREKGTLTNEEIAFVINGYMTDQIKDYQVSALLMAICINGMNEEETLSLTSAMLHSGDIFDMSGIPGVKVDKHSTGGVGDKTTLVVAPLAASCGLVVSKMSGRGLGHTGGTIDKLEAINKFNVDLTHEQFMKQLVRIGVAITTSSLNIDPADKKLYALRDVTGTVSSLPLIASSIMSKKLATNADKIVLDVKVGNGALIKDKEEAKALAEIMIKIGKNFGKETIAVITNMDYPLGNNIGNGLEVKEAIETLQGRGDKNFREVCVTLAAHMVSVAKNISFENAKFEVSGNLNAGRAYEKFTAMVLNQGGDINNIAIAPKTIEYQALKTGYLNSIDALELGKYVMKMGAGRENKDDVIDYGVGMTLKHHPGDYVNAGDVLAVLYINEDIIDMTPLNNIFVIEENPTELKPLIYGVIK